MECLSGRCVIEFVDFGDGRCRRRLITDPPDAGGLLRNISCAEEVLDGVPLVVVVVVDAATAPDVDG